MFAKLPKTAILRKISRRGSDWAALCKLGACHFFAKCPEGAGLRIRTTGIFRKTAENVDFAKNQPAREWLDGVM